MARKSRFSTTSDSRHAWPADLWRHGRRLRVLMCLVLVQGFQTLLGCSPETREEPDPGEDLRIVGLAPSLNEWVLALGGKDFLVARTDYDTHPDLLRLPSVGEGLDPSMERLVALEVTVVLLTEGRATASLQERLGSLGIRGVVLPANTLADLHQTVARLGGLLDRPEAADSLSRHLDQELSRIRERVGDLEPVDVMYVVGANPPITTGDGTFIHDLLEIAGGRNVFQDAGMRWPMVGFEAILERNPEVLIWPSGEERDPSLDYLQATPGWRDIPAVRNGRIVKVQGDLFNRPGPRLAMAARILAEALHPQVFPAGEGGWQ